MRSHRLLALSFLVSLVPFGCAQGGVGSCVTSADCPSGRCVDGTCVDAPATDGGTTDGGTTDGGPVTDAAIRDDSGAPVDSGPPPPACTADGECDDGDMCTMDACESGTCARTAIACDDGDACTDDACAPATGCASTPTSCDDGDACTADSCDSVTGCAHAATSVLGGSCATPIDISAGGTFTGDSTCASSDFSGVCLGASGPDIAFALDLAAESDVTLDARASSFAGVLFVGATCGDGATACDSDGTPMLTTRLSAGRHYVGLDGRASSDAGAFSLAVTITPVVRDELLTFPIASDTHFAASGTNYWNAGDYIQGSRTTGLASITSADLVLSISSNVLTCDNQSMQLRINGTIVGPVTIAPGATTFSRSYSFAALTGPTYTVRLETTRTVNGGCGSAGFPDGVSTLRVRR